MDYAEIGKNIRTSRIRKNLKQAQLAELVHVSTQHISHVECGLAKLSLPLLIEIAAILAEDFYTLLGSNIARPAGEDSDFSEVLKDASQAQRALCLQLCKDVMEHT